MFMQALEGLRTFVRELQGPKMVWEWDMEVWAGLAPEPQEEGEQIVRGPKQQPRESAPRAESLLARA